MIPSPLQLETHFFTKIRVDACNDHPENPGEGIPSCDVECLKHKKEEGKWLVRLDYKLDRAPAKGVPGYVMDVEIVGRFRVDPAYPAEKTESMVRANGPAVLYGAIREMICNLTARGPFPAVRLPTVTFIDGTAGVAESPAARARTHTTEHATPSEDRTRQTSPGVGKAR